jgi:hypothetical protein
MAAMALFLKHGAWSVFLTKRTASGNVGRMTKKRLLLIASLPAAIVVTLGILAVLPAQPGVSKTNFDRIETGMAPAPRTGAVSGRALVRRL